MSAAEIAAVPGGARQGGRAWRCRCPLHGGRSLLLHDGGWWPPPAGMAGADAGRSRLTQGRMNAAEISAKIGPCNERAQNAAHRSGLDPSI